MREKEFIIKKISTLLYSFDIVSLTSILRAMQNLKERRDSNAGDKRIPGISD